jgi:hypothetical protein
VRIGRPLVVGAVAALRLLALGLDLILLLLLTKRFASALDLRIPVGHAPGSSRAAQTETRSGFQLYA